MIDTLEWVKTLNLFINIRRLKVQAYRSECKRGGDD